MTTWLDIVLLVLVAAAFLALALINPGPVSCP